MSDFEWQRAPTAGRYRTQGCVLRLAPSIRHDVRYAHCKVSVSECLKLDLVVVVDQQHNLI
jgi:hypothetical protein